MARAKQTKKKGKVDLSKKVDSLVEEIEHTHELKKKEIEEAAKKKDSEENKAELKEENKKEISKKIEKIDNKKEKEDFDDVIEDIIDKKNKDEKTEEKEEDTSIEKVENNEDNDKKDDSTEFLDMDEIKEELQDVIDVAKDKIDEIEQLEKTLTEQLEIIDDNTDIFEKIKEEKKEESKEEKKDLNKTNSYNMKFDDGRLAESESLDTSFLEGRIKKNSEEQAKKLTNSSNVNKEYNEERKELLKKLLWLFIVVVCIVGTFILLKNHPIKFTKIEENKNKEIINKDNTSSTNKLIDDNYIFLGTSQTKDYKLSDYYTEMPVVNSGIDDTKLFEIKDKLRDEVYKYNPSKVFIELGIYDYMEGENSDYITEHLETIIKEIKKNRPYAQIYVESIYPINNTNDDKINSKLIRELDNDEIRIINKSIEKMCDKNNITYIDIFNSLLDQSEENLNINYTTDGLNLSDEGYEVITKIIKKYL